MDISTESCPTCGAPLRCGGAISLPEGDEHAGEGALYFAWTCGHDSLLPMPFDEQQLHALLALRGRVQRGFFADDWQPQQPLTGG